MDIEISSQVDVINPLVKRDILENMDKAWGSLQKISQKVQACKSHSAIESLLFDCYPRVFAHLSYALWLAKMGIDK